MGLSTSYTSSEVQAYEGLLNLISAVSDLLKQPPDMQQVRIDALQAITDAKSAMSDLENKKSLFDADNKAAIDKLNSIKDDNNQKFNDIANAQKDLDIRAASLKDSEDRLQTLKISLASREIDVSSRERQIADMSSSLADKQSSLNDLQSKLNNMQNDIDDKNDAITAKEAALRQILS